MAEEPSPSAWFFPPDFFIPYDFSLQRRPWAQFTLVQACFELSHPQRSRQQQATSANQIGLTTFVVPLLPTATTARRFQFRGECDTMRKTWVKGKANACAAEMSFGNSSILPASKCILSERERAGSLVLGQKWSCTCSLVRGDVQEADEVTGQSGWQCSAPSGKRAGQAALGMLVEAAQCTLHAGLLKSIWLGSQRPSCSAWVAEISKRCLSPQWLPHKLLLRGKCKHAASELVFRGLAECSGTSSPKYIWCACLTYSMAVPGLCMLLNNFPIVSLVTLLSVFGLALFLCPSPFKA